MSMTEIKVGDTVRWRKGGKRTAVVIHMSILGNIVRLDRPLRGATIYNVDDLAVVKPAKKESNESR